MSTHRRVCISEAPGIIGPALDGHMHQCVHDAESPLDAAPIEHQCGCGMTWTEPRPEPRPEPDTSWITMEERRGPGIWPLVAILAIAALIAQAIIGMTL